MNKKKKKKPKQQNKPSQPTVKLSQCMIVKNEEKNIERALEWAKDIAFEQIVVDTGSTDRTVELAEKMGAKVYHFEWINDFSAAKNYAMDQAKGDWIAILDADEYMSKKDAKEILSLIKKINNDPVASKECDAVTCTFVNLDDNGNAASVIKHQRFFQNRSYLRYEGRIHEEIKLRHGHANAPQVRILHTGYTQATNADKDKKNRNVEMLRNELKNDPGNPEKMFYLADSLKGSGTKEAIDEAEAIFKEALKSTRPVNPLYKQFAYNFLIPRYLKTNETKEEAKRLCDEAIKNLPNFVDYYYYRAAINNQKGNYKAAQDDLAVCENIFMSSDSIPTTQILMPSPILLFYQQRIAAQGLNDEAETTKTSTILQFMLKEGKDNPDIIGPYIRAMLWDGATDDDVLKELSEIYNLNDPKDILFIARAAKDSGAMEFTRNIMKIAGQMLGGNTNE